MQGISSMPSKNIMRRHRIGLDPAIVESRWAGITKPNMSSSACQATYMPFFINTNKNYPNTPTLTT
eukprot:2043753-Ditylum_brightwellii.AAC.1